MSRPIGCNCSLRSGPDAKLFTRKQLVTLDQAEISQEWPGPHRTDFCPLPGPAGLIAAAANGRKGGRPRKVDDAAARKARNLREKGVNVMDIGKMLGVSRATVYRYLAAGDDAAPQSA